MNERLLTLAEQCTEAGRRAEAVAALEKVLAGQRGGMNERMRRIFGELRYDWRVRRGEFLTPAVRAAVQR